MNPMDLIVELRKRYGIKASKHDYVQLATSDSSVAYLEPGTEQP